MENRVQQFVDADGQLPQLKFEANDATCVITGCGEFDENRKACIYMRFYHIKNLILNDWNDDIIDMIDNIDHWDLPGGRFFEDASQTLYSRRFFHQPSDHELPTEEQFIEQVAARLYFETPSVFINNGGEQVFYKPVGVDYVVKSVEVGGGNPKSSKGFIRLGRGTDTIPPNQLLVPNSIVQERLANLPAAVIVGGNLNPADQIPLIFANLRHIWRGILADTETLDVSLQPIDQATIDGLGPGSPMRVNQVSPNEIQFERCENDGRGHDICLKGSILWDPPAVPPIGFVAHQLTLRPYHFNANVPEYRDLIRLILHNSDIQNPPISVEITRFEFVNHVLDNYSPKIRVFRRPVRPFSLYSIHRERVNSVAFNGLNEFPGAPENVRIGNRIDARDIPEIRQTLTEFGKLSLRGDEVLPPVQLTRFRYRSIIKGCKVTVGGRHLCAMIEVYHCTPAGEGADCITRMIPQVRISPNQWTSEGGVYFDVGNDPIPVNLPDIADVPPQGSVSDDLHVYFISILLNVILTQQPGLTPVSVKVEFIEPPTRYTFLGSSDIGNIYLSPQHKFFAYIRNLEM